VKDYGVYIAAAYAVTFAVLGLMALSALFARRRAEKANRKK
jgi:heme exporter protein CcmD